MVEYLLIEASVCGVRSWDHVLAKALYLSMMVATRDGVGDRRPMSVSGYHTRLKDVALTISKKDGTMTFKAEVVSKVTKGHKGSRVIYLDSSAESSTNILDPIQYLLAISLRVGSVDATSVDELISTTLGDGDTGFIRWKYPERFLHPSFDNEYTVNMDRRLLPEQIEIILAQVAERVGLDMDGRVISGPQTAQETKVNRKRVSMTDVVAPKLSKVPKITPIGVKPANSSRSPRSAYLSPSRNSYSAVSNAGSVDSVAVMSESLYPRPDLSLAFGNTMGASAPQSTIMDGSYRSFEEDYTERPGQPTEQDLLGLDLDFSLLEPEKNIYPPTHSVSAVANNPYFAVDDDDVFSQGLSDDDYDALTPLALLPTDDVLNGDSNLSVPELSFVTADITSSFIHAQGFSHQSPIDPALETSANATSFRTAAATAPPSTSNGVSDTSTSAVLSYESSAKAAVFETMALPHLEFLRHLAKVNITDVPMTGKRMRNDKEKIMNGGSRDPLTSFIYRCWVTPGCAWQSTIELFQEHHELSCSETPWEAPKTQPEYGCELCSYISTAKDPERGLNSHIKGVHEWEARKCNVEGCDDDTLFATEHTYRGHLARHSKSKKTEDEKESEEDGQ